MRHKIWKCLGKNEKNCRSETVHRYCGNGNGISEISVSIIWWITKTNSNTSTKIFDTISGFRFETYFCRSLPERINVFEKKCTRPLTLILANKFFTVNTKLEEMVAMASRDLTPAKKSPPVGLHLMQEIITGWRVQCLTNWAKLAFACKSETVRPLHSYALLVLGLSSKC